MNRTLLTFLLLFSAFSALNAQSGLKGDYYRGRNFEYLVFSRIDPQINFNWDNRTPGPGIPSTDYSIRWTGRIQVPESGEYQFSAVVDDGIRMWVGGVKVIDAWGPHDHASVGGKVKMKADQLYDIRVDYFNGILEGQIKLLWELPHSSNSILEKFLSKPELIKPTFFSPPPIPEAAPVREALPVGFQKRDTATQKPEVKQVVKPIAPLVVATKPEEISKPQPPKPSQPQNRMRDTILKYTPKNVLFSRGEPFILEESFPELDRLVKLLLRFESLTIQIDGHTDITGDPELNLQLSRDRANEVAYYLKE